MHEKKIICPYSVMDMDSMMESIIQDFDASVSIYEAEKVKTPLDQKLIKILDDYVNSAKSKLVILRNSLIIARDINISEDQEKNLGISYMYLKIAGETVIRHLGDIKATS
ncbi:MAG: hypothetical protein IE916_00325 [Epsilonproteobacteria bacterium]|nr:hypothetical protein [Campylobacterota bacterium]